jgi:hypothetical protein
MIYSHYVNGQNSQIDNREASTQKRNNSLPGFPLPEGDSETRGCKFTVMPSKKNSGEQMSSISV